jgi:hypothetical protein
MAVVIFNHLTGRDREWPRDLPPLAGFIYLVRSNLWL